MTQDSLRRLLTPVAAQGLQRVGGPPPGLISMRGGTPDPRVFPAQELAAAAERVLRREAQVALQYGGAMGAAELRDYIAARAQRIDGREVTREHVLLSSGGNQALGLLFEALLNPGDYIALEAPTYTGTVNWAKSRGLNTLSIPMDAEGMQVEVLAEQAAKLRREGGTLKFAYVISTFHNPTGTELSIPRRKRLVELAGEFGFMIFEDETYKDLRFEGEPLPSLYSLGGPERVVKLGSFSKTIAPGIRMGYAVGQPELIAVISTLRTDLGTSAWLSKTVAEYLNTHDFDTRIKEVSVLYRAKRDRIMASLGEHCAPYVSWHTPRGGFFLWLKLAQPLQAKRVLTEAQKEGLDFNVGNPYFMGNEGSDHIRLCFVTASLDEIERGIAGLGRALTRSA